MASRKPELNIPVDDIVKAVAKVIAKMNKKPIATKIPSRGSVRGTIRSNSRANAYNTIRNDASTKGMTDEQIIKYVAKSKPKVTRQQVKNVRNSYKGGR